MVTFDPETASALMAALLLWDLSNEESAAQPTNTGKHPMTLFCENAVHGGSWGCAYSTESISVASFLLGKVTRGRYTPAATMIKMEDA